jgi:hypothetical protein
MFAHLVDYIVGASAWGAARAPLDFGNVFRSGKALTLQQRAARWGAPNRASGGLLVAAALRRPGPRQLMPISA